MQAGDADKEKKAGKEKTGDPSPKAAADGRFDLSRRTLFSDLFSEFSRIVSRTFAYLFLDVRIEGMENLPPKGACLVAATHQSYLDPWLIAIMLPRLSYYLAKEELFRIPVLGWLLRTYSTLPVPRGQASARGVLKRAVEVLEEEQVLVMFPEGTRSADGHLKPFQGGISLIVRRTGAAVLPVLVIDAYRIWPRGHWLPRLRVLPRLLSPGKLRLRLVFGEPIWYQDGESDDSFLERLTGAYRALAEERDCAWMVDGWPPPKKSSKRRSAATETTETETETTAPGENAPGRPETTNQIRCVTDEGCWRHSSDRSMVGRHDYGGLPSRLPLQPASTRLQARADTTPQALFAYGDSFRVAEHGGETRILLERHCGASVGLKGF